MDTVTQVLVGVTTSEIGFRRRLGKPANRLAALSALLPDLDFILYPFAGEWWFMTGHRGPTHTFLFVLLAPFLLAWPFWRKHKTERSYWEFWACSFVALLSHPILDLCTTYGTPVFMPFSSERFGWDFIGIIDFVYSPLLVLTLLLNLLGKR